MAVYAAKSGLMPAPMGLVGLPHASPETIKLFIHSSFLLLFPPYGIKFPRQGEFVEKCCKKQNNRI